MGISEKDLRKFGGIAFRLGVRTLENDLLKEMSKIGSLRFEEIEKIANRALKKHPGSTK